MELYSYGNDKFEYTIKQESLTAEKTCKNFLKYSITFESPYASSLAVNNNVYGELFLKENFFKKNSNISPSSKNQIPDKFKYYDKEIPFMILLHGFSTGNEKLKTYHNFIYNMLDENVACLFINLPFHLKRRPHSETSGRRLIYYDDLDTLLFFHQCVVDVRKSINIIDSIFSPLTIIICGISLGSIVSIITAALEKKIKKGIFILGGGNWEEIHWNGILRFMLKGNCAGDEIISRQKCHRYYSNFPKFLERLIKINPDKLTTELSEDFELKNLCTKKCYLCDPLIFAHKIDPGKVIMINSRIDHFFSKKSTMYLWEGLGKPEIHWCNYPHLSRILNKKKILKTIKEFIRKK